MKRVLIKVAVSTMIAIPTVKWNRNMTETLTKCLNFTQKSLILQDYEQSQNEILKSNFQTT